MTLLPFSCGNDRPAKLIELRYLAIIRDKIWNLKGTYSAMTEQRKLTGKASIDRPWLQYYPEEFRNASIPECSVTEYLKQRITDETEIALNYYGNDLTWASFWQQVDATAKALRAIGIQTGDCIPMFLQAVPEYLILLLAAEKIGAALLCRDDTPEACAEAIRSSKSKVLFAHDYLSKEEEELFLRETQMERIVTVSPYRSAHREAIPSYICDSIEAHYTAESACNQANLTWDEFIAQGETWTGDYTAPKDVNRPLVAVYTSGSTGPSKLVFQAARQFTSVFYQLSTFEIPAGMRLIWHFAALPPALIATTATMMLLPMSIHMYLVLNPFCELENFDLELMRIQPNCWPLTPMMMEQLVKSPRIPADYDMSHFFVAGGGSEGINNKRLERVQQFLTSHHSPALYDINYGLSESCAAATLPCRTLPVKDGCCGMPMPASFIASFEYGTQKELGYGEIGEICISGSNVMLGYDDVQSTKERLQIHEDGRLWLHTGDYGYVSEEGLLYVLTRGREERYGGGILLSMEMENRVVAVSGVSDAFFLTMPDEEHEGYFIPHLYVVLEDHVTLESVEDAIYGALEVYQRPVQITVITERPYFHFKTNRVGLAKELREGIYPSEILRELLPENTEDCVAASAT